MHELEASKLVLYLILYVMLPIWSLAALVDWNCHRLTKIEETSGLRESVIHFVMGVQIGAPIFLCMFFEVNITILLLCLFVLITHEIVAHMDIVWASSRRHISHWETHAHTYLSSLPLYLFALVVVREWDVFLDMITRDWTGGMALVLRSEPLSGNNFYLPFLVVGSFIFGLVPYMEEMYRCWSYEKRMKERDA